jgi:hypothetical protein
MSTQDYKALKDWKSDPTMRMAHDHPFYVYMSTQDYKALKDSGRLHYSSQLVVSRQNGDPKPVIIRQLERMCHVDPNHGTARVFMTYSLDSRLAIPYRGWEKPMQPSSLELTVGTLKMEVTPKSWERNMDTENILAGETRVYNYSGPWTLKK